MQQIKVIAFDADDTLWDNQVFYDKVESEFCHLLAGYGTAEEISSRLFAINTGLSRSRSPWWRLP